MKVLFKTETSVHFVHFRRRAALMISALESRSRGTSSSPGARFSKAPETFQVRKAIFSSYAPANEGVYTPVTSCMKGTSVHIQDKRIKKLCMGSLVRYQVEHSKRSFAMAFRVRKLFGTFEKRARQTVSHSTQDTEYEAQR